MEHCAVKRLIKIFICINILLIASGLHAEPAQQRKEQNYFEHYPSDWTKIVPNQETVLVANSESGNVRVTIRPRTAQGEKTSDKKPTVGQSQCKYDYCIDIAVNGKQIIVPYSVFCTFSKLNRAKVFIENKKSILMLDGGAESAGYFVKIEFSRERVTRKTIYADSSIGPDVLLEETTYHVAIFE